MSRLRWVNGYLATDEPSPEQAAWEAATGAADVLARVEARLVAAGALTELRQFQGLSAQEVDVLVYRELHAGVTVPSGCPQTTRASVAA